MGQTATQKTTDELFRRLPFWIHLTEDERGLVQDRQYVARYTKGQVVCGGHTDCLGLVLMIQGVLRTYLLSPDGKEVTLYRVRDGEPCVMAAACVLHSISFETHVEAESDAEALIIPIDAYSALMNNNPHVKAYSYEMATARFSDVVAGMERLLFMSLEQRLAAFLLEEASEADSDTVRMTHEQIAASIGSAREAVGRTLKGMASQELVELFRGGVRLTDKAALQLLIAL